MGIIFGAEGVFTKTKKVHPIETRAYGESVPPTPDTLIRRNARVFPLQGEAITLLYYDVGRSSLNPRPRKTRGYRLANNQKTSTYPTLP